MTTLTHIHFRFGMLNRQRRIIIPNLPKRNTRILTRTALNNNRINRNRKRIRFILRTIPSVTRHMTQPILIQYQITTRIRTTISNHTTAQIVTRRQVNPQFSNRLHLHITNIINSTILKLTKHMTIRRHQHATNRPFSRTLSRITQINSNTLRRMTNTVNSNRRPRFLTRLLLTLTNNTRNHRIQSLTRRTKNTNLSTNIQMSLHIRRRRLSQLTKRRRTQRILRTSIMRHTITTSRSRQQTRHMLNITRIPPIRSLRHNPLHNKHTISNRFRLNLTSPTRTQHRLHRITLRRTRHRQKTILRRIIHPQRKM